MNPEIEYNDSYWYVDGCIKAYLQGKKPLSWILSIVRGTEIHLIKNILSSVDIDSKRSDDLLEAIEN